MSKILVNIKTRDIPVILNVVNVKHIKQDHTSIDKSDHIIECEGETSNTNIVEGFLDWLNQTLELTTKEEIPLEYKTDAILCYPKDNRYKLVSGCYVYKFRTYFSTSSRDILMKVSFICKSPTTFNDSSI